jgi:hypothetical protein
MAGDGPPATVLFSDVKGLDADLHRHDEGGGTSATTSIGVSHHRVIHAFRPSASGDHV